MPNVKVPIVDEVVRWIKDGKKLTWIVDEIQRKYGVKVGYSTVVDIRRRNDIPALIGRHDDLIPWPLRKEHRHKMPPKMLRALGRRRNGEPLGPTVERELDRWLVARAETSPEAPYGTVVHYNPLTKEGWFYVARRPGIDNDLIRVPDEDASVRTRTRRDH